VALKPGGLGAGGGIPQLDGVVMRARGDAAVGKLYEGVDRFRVALKPGGLGAGGGIPQLDGVVMRARGDAAVGKLGEGVTYSKTCSIF